MLCTICGDVHHIQYYPAKRLALCSFCAEHTPDKVSKTTFDAAYWEHHIADVPLSIQKEFYDDYRTSSLTVAEYIRATGTSR